MGTGLLALPPALLPRESDIRAFRTMFLTTTRISLSSAAHRRWGMSASMTRVTFLLLLCSMWCPMRSCLGRQTVSAGFLVTSSHLHRPSHVAKAPYPCTGTARLGPHKEFLRTHVVLPHTGRVTRTLRGGGSGSPLQLADFTKEAVQYFKDVRTPASFLVGASLSALFLFENKVGTAGKEEKVVMNMYHAFMLLAFALSMSTVVISTAAGVTIMYGAFNPVATTPYMLLKSEFLFEFASARWGFLVSLFCFILGVTNRAILAFGLLRPQKRNSLLFVLFTVASLVTHLLSYINQTLYCWPNLLAMTVDLFKMIVRRCFREKRPLQLVSVVTAILGTVYAFKTFVMDVEQKSDA